MPHSTVLNPGAAGGTCNVPVESSKSSDAGGTGSPVRVPTSLTRDLVHVDRHGRRPVGESRRLVKRAGWLCRAGQTFVMGGEVTGS